MDGNVTQSILQFTPAMSHLDGLLRCSASNPLTPHHQDISADWQLNISCEYYLWWEVEERGVQGLKGLLCDLAR